MEGLTNIYLENFLFPQSAYFQGVYSANNIANKFFGVPRFSIICNLSNYGERGTHFITIIAFPEFVLYIDSLGLPCFNSSISHFLIRLQRAVYYSNRAIQHWDSSFCGFFCILNVLIYESELSVKFSSLPEQNDKICIRNIIRVLSHRKMK